MIVPFPPPTSASSRGSEESDGAVLAGGNRMGRALPLLPPADSSGAVPELKSPL